MSSTSCGERALDLNIVQYSDKFMNGIVLHCIVLLRSLLYCIQFVNLVNVKHLQSIGQPFLVFGCRSIPRDTLTLCRTLFRTGAIPASSTALSYFFLPLLANSLPITQFASELLYLLLLLCRRLGTRQGQYPVRAEAI